MGRGRSQTKGSADTPRNRGNTPSSDGSLVAVTSTLFALRQEVIDAHEPLDLNTEASSELARLATELRRYLNAHGIAVESMTAGAVIDPEAAIQTVVDELEGLRLQGPNSADPGLRLLARFARGAQRAIIAEGPAGRAEVEAETAARAAGRRSAGIDPRYQSDLDQYSVKELEQRAAEAVAETEEALHDDDASWLDVARAARRAAALAEVVEAAYERENAAG